jgi:hypothetical protein
MTSMTVHRSSPRPTTRRRVTSARWSRRIPVELALAVVGFLAAIAGTWLAPVPVALIVAAATGSLDHAGGFLDLGTTFLVVTLPVVAIWLLGALGTHRAIRQLGGLNSGDRAAIAELMQLLKEA